MSSFKTILVEAETIIGKLKDDMKTKLKRAALTSSRLTEYVRLLLELGEPADQLQIQFLDWQKARLITAMKECKLEGDEERKWSTKSFVVEMNRVFVDEFVEVCRQHAVMFPQVRDLSSSFAKHIVEFSKFTFTSYFDDIRKHLLSISSPDDDEKEGDETAKSKSATFFVTLSESLEILRNSIQPAHLMVPQARLNDRVAEITEGAVRIFSFVAHSHSLISPRTNSPLFAQKRSCVIKSI